jgi:general secretion pathway protein D
MVSLAAWAIACAAMGQSVVTGVSARQVGEGLEVKVSGRDLPRPTVQRVLGGRAFILEFRAELEGKGRRVSTRHAGVDFVQWGWYRARPPIIRVQLRLDPKVEPRVTQDETGWMVRVNTVADVEEIANPAATVSTPKPKADAVEPFPNEVPPIEPVRTSAPNPRVQELRVTRLESRRPAMVSLEFVNTDIVQILKGLALQAGVNIVTAPEVKGQLTVSLNNVTVDEALKLVTSLADVEYAQVGATYIVTPNAKLETIKRRITGEVAPTQEGDMSDTYVVKGGTARDLIAAVAGKEANKVGRVTLMATPAGSNSRQTVVLRGPREEVADLVRTFEQLDNADAKLDTFHLYDVKYLDPRPLREELIATIPGLRATILPASVANPRVFRPEELATQSRTAIQTDTAKDKPKEGEGEGGGSSEVQDIQAAGDKRSDREERGITQPFNAFETVAVPMKIVLRGTQAQIDQALAYLEKIDVQPKRIAMELRVMELSKEDALRVGLDWNILSTNGAVRAFRMNQGLGDTSVTPGTFTGVFSEGSSVLATLDKVANDRNLLARPNLLAVDGRESELFVGDVVRFVRSIQATQNGTTIEIGEERVGVRLAVLPRVGGEGTITLDMRPIISVLRGFTAVPGGGNLPQTSERIVQSTAVMKSGETIALGGLIQDEDRDNVRGIPILGDLPIIGALFRRTERTKQRTEVVFFLTAKVVTNDGERAADPRVNDPTKKNN